MEIAELYKIYLQHPSVQTDTRKLKAGDLFFALSGPNFDGNAFAADALQKGAAFAVIDNPAFATGDRTIVVNNTLDALQQLAKYHRQQLKIPFLAITGSNGKTTTKELIAAVLSHKYVTYATEGNLNNHIGVPLTILKINSDAEIAIIEMGANHQKEIASYCTIALPTHGLITNCGKAHIEGFGGVEGVKKGKGELYDFLRESDGIIFRNTDLAYLNEMAHDIKQQVTYGTVDADYTGSAHMEGVLLKVDVQVGNKIQTIETNLVGAYNAPNVLAAFAVGSYFGLRIEAISNAIAAYNPDNSRSQWIVRGTNRIIMDAYNANPTSMKAAIVNFATAELQNKMLWIGGMKEMGVYEAEEHNQLITMISGYSWEGVILVGPEFRNLIHSYLWFETSTEAAAHIKQHVPQNCSILIKGSRGSKMEIMAEALPA